MPATFWDDDALRAALADQHVGRVLRAYRHHPWHGRRPISQSELADWLRLDQPQISRIESGPTVTDLVRLTTWAKILGIPAHLLWFKLPGQSVDAPRGVRGRATESAVETSSISRIAAEAIGTIAWVEQSNLGEDTLAALAENTHRLAEEHSRTAPADLLVDVLSTHRSVQELLRGGRQRLRQTRDLISLDTQLLAHTCILLGDLHHDEVAITYGKAAHRYAQEAGVNPAEALSALAKTERWRGNYARSAELARQGYECSPPAPVRVLLAAQEANAVGLLGDHGRAQRALSRAEEAAAGPLAEDSGVTPWSCPRPRQALYALSVAVRTGTGNPDGALRAAQAADAGWAEGEPWIYGTWAQIRFGAGIAHVLKDDLDGAIQQVTPALELAPEFRLATITGYITELDTRLGAPRFRGSATAARLCEQIRWFAAVPLSIGKGNFRESTT